AVPPAYTSQRCACCGHTAKENRLTQSKFVCRACGYTENADVNGARNILAAGHAVLGVVCGRGRNPTLRLWPAIFSGEIDVFPSERRNMGQEIGR
ncbi:transposase, partial [Escherichia coli]|uniref:transposase n=1 Tax=Escherichia coli TaxID=562 RepID=UPI00201909EC